MANISNGSQKINRPNLAMLMIFAILIFVSILSLGPKQKATVQSQAQVPGPTCLPNCVTEPPCCAQILVKYHQLGDITGLPDNEQPYHQCPWTENSNLTNLRAYCLPSTCNQLPSGKAYRGGCNWYWSFHGGDTDSPQGYGCMIGPENAMRPICGGGGNPTQPPNPTRKPTPRPSPTPYNYPTTSPTSFLTPTLGPNPTEPENTPEPNPTEIIPTNEPQALFPTTSNPQGQSPPASSLFPNPIEIIGNIIGTIFEKKSSPTQSPFTSPIIPPQLIPTTTASINQNAPKSLDLFSYLFEKVTYYDNLLNQTINNEIKKIVK